MPGYTLYKRIFAQFLLLCVCLAAANTCPNRKLVTAGTHITTVRLADSGTHGGHSICSKGILKTSFHEAFKTGGDVSFSGATMAFSLNLLNNTPGTAFYRPPEPPRVLKPDPCPLFLKNEALIV